MGKLYQFLGTAIICSMGLNMGIIFTWPAFTLVLFGSPETPLNRPMTDTEVSLLSSLCSFGALTSTPIAGLMLQKLGRRRSCVINALALVIVWMMLSFSRQVEVVLSAMFLSGVSSSAILIASIYISEICENSIRGTMSATNMVSYGIGMLISYLFGGILSYQAMLYVGLTLTVVGTCCLLLLKESPMYLLIKGQEKEAIQSLAFYRQLKVNSKELLEEISTMKHALNPDFDDASPTPEEEKLKPDQKSAKKLSFWKFIKKSQSSRRAFFVCFIVMTAAIFQGLVVVQIYVEPIFSVAIPTMSPSVCSVILAAVTVVAGIVAAYLTDVAGRRFLMIYASLGTGISCVILGTQMQLNWGPSWITGLFIYVFTVLYTFGAGTVPFVLLAEIFLPEIKSIFNMILIEYAWLCNSIVLFIFNPLLKALGWGPVFYIFAFVCFATSIFSVFFLPETKGLNVDAIQALFAKKRTRPNLY